MTERNTQIRAVILAALMVFSVFAGTVALSGTAAADVSNIGNTNATDVTAGSSGQTQTVSFNATGGSSGDETFTLVYSDSGLSDVTAASISDTDVTVTGEGSVNNTSVSNGDIVVGIDNVNTTTTDLSNQTSVSIDATVDVASGISTGSRTLDIDTATSGNVGSASFNINDAGGGADNRAANADGTGDFDTADGEGYVFDGATVFQGESGLQLGGSLSNGIVKTAGNAEGVPLEVPDVPQDQATGRYTTDGASGSDGVTVQRPRVTTLDVENAQGADIAGGSVPQGDDNEGSGELTVVGSWNYEDAEDLEVTVENDDGLDVTGDAITGNDDPGGTSDPATRTASDVGQMGAGSNEVNWDLDLSDLNTGTFTITLAGTDDLDFGEASQSTTVTVTGDDDVSLDLDSSRVTRGEDVTFRIRGSNAGDFHV
ncbi:major cell surface glycoprotein (TIGR04216 family), partial [Haloplanus aerogenes]